MFEFFKKLRIIVKNYDADKARTNSRISAAENFIRERTEVHADIHTKSPCQMVMIGRYQGKDFVNIYAVGQGEFESLLKHLREVDKYARPGRFDSPWPEVNAVIDREFRR